MKQTCPLYYIWPIVEYYAIGNEMQTHGLKLQCQKIIWADIRNMQDVEPLYVKCLITCHHIVKIVNLQLSDVVFSDDMEENSEYK